MTKKRERFNDLETNVFVARSGLVRLFASDDDLHFLRLRLVVQAGVRMK